MFKVGSFGRLSVFTVVGYREEKPGILSGPHPIVKAISLNQARQACAAALWVEMDKWCCVAIEGKDGLELARFSRFPPDRQPEYSDDIFGTVAYQVRHSNGARLAVAAGGTMKRKKEAA